MIRVLIYGHAGWIGQQIIQCLKQNTQIQIILGGRIWECRDLEKELQETQPDRVICLIGRTHGQIGEQVYTTIDYLEQKGKVFDNVRDNLYSPILLARLCEKMGIHMSYMGTGCIFEYDEEHRVPSSVEDRSPSGFKEDSSPNFRGSAYSIVKGFTDMLIQTYENVLNVRIRMPITHTRHPRNFITKITKYEYICSIRNSMTVLDELLPLLVDMILQKQVGTINLVNPGAITHNEILEMYREIVDPTFTWKNFSAEEQSRILSAGRSNNYLDTTQLEKLYPHVANIRDAVRKCLLNMKE